MEQCPVTLKEQAPQCLREDCVDGCVVHCHWKEVNIKKLAHLDEWQRELNTYLIHTTSLLNGLQKGMCHLDSFMLVLLEVSEVDDMFDHVPVIIDPVGDSAHKHEHHV